MIYTLGNEYSKYEKIKNIHGKCGVLTLCMNDPFSLLMYITLNIPQDEPIAIGVYYTGSVRGDPIKVYVYNVFDKQSVKTIKFSCSIEELLNYDHIKKVTLYPFDESYMKGINDKFKNLVINNFNSFDSKEKISKTILFRDVIIDKMLGNEIRCWNKNNSYYFINKILSILSENVLDDKNSYRSINKFDFLQNSYIIAEDLLSAYQCKNNLDHTVNSVHIVSSAHPVSSIDKNVKEDMIKFAAVATELFYSSNEIREKLLNLFLINDEAKKIVKEIKYNPTLDITNLYNLVNESNSEDNLIFKKS